MFSDEAVFYGNGEVNRQNTRYWSQHTPHWYTDSKEQGETLLMVWCGIWKDRIIGPFLFNEHVNGIIKRVFLDWLKRLNLCIGNNGGHMEQVL
jgi:hypothetical protein